jgi:hypothetical protein
MKLPTTHTNPAATQPVTVTIECSTQSGTRQSSIQGWTRVRRRFENPSGARGSGGKAHEGRKGAPNRRVASGERVVLADLSGPGVVRHLWMTFPPALPEVMRGDATSMEHFGALLG